MPARRITKEEWIDAKRIVDIAFWIGQDLSKEAEKEIPEYELDENRDHWRNFWGYFDENNRMLATYIEKQFMMRYDGHDVKMGGIGGVASLPETRRSGNVRSMFAEMLREDLKNGVVFSVLAPFSHVYYRQYGYELALTFEAVSFPTESFKQWNCDFEAEMIVQDGCFREMKEVYDAFIADKNMAIRRSDAHWANQVHIDPHSKKRYTYLLRREGKAVAYVSWRPGSEENGRTLEVVDWAYVGREGLQAVLGFLYRFAGSFKTTHIWPMPSDLDMLSLVPEAWNVKTDRKTVYMARAVDVKAALEGMHHEVEGKYSLYITDDFLPENTGLYVVEASADGVKVERREEGQADLCCTVQTLTQLCLGYQDLHGVTFKQDVQINGNEKLLRQIFVKKPCYVADFF